MDKIFEKSLTRTLLLAFPTLAVVGVAQAQMDAESLPEAPSTTGSAFHQASDAQGPESDAANATTAADGAETDEVAAVEGSERSGGPTWESYNLETNESVAQEVTSGVRVEDIVEPPTDYRFAAFGKSDPFVPPVATREGKSSGATVDPLEIPIVSPLQKFNLTDLSVVGIWQLANGERKAMILAKDDRAAQGIIVKAGDPVGNRGGKIVEINDNIVTVREFMLAPDGTRQYEDQQMIMGGAEDDASGTIRFVPGATQTELLIDGEPSKPASPVLPPVAGLVDESAAAGTPRVGDVASTQGEGAPAAPQAATQAAPQIGLDNGLSVPIPMPMGGGLAPAATTNAANTQPNLTPPPSGGVSQIAQPPGSF